MAVIMSHSHDTTLCETRHNLTTSAKAITISPKDSIKTKGLSIDFSSYHWWSNCVLASIWSTGCNSIFNILSWLTGRVCKSLLCHVFSLSLKHTVSLFSVILFLWQSVSIVKSFFWSYVNDERSECYGYLTSLDLMLFFSNGFLFQNLNSFPVTDSNALASYW